MNSSIVLSRVARAVTLAALLALTACAPIEPSPGDEAGLVVGDGTDGSEAVGTDPAATGATDGSDPDVPPPLASAEQGALAVGAGGTLTSGSYQLRVVIGAPVPINTVTAAVPSGGN